MLPVDPQAGFRRDGNWRRPGAESGANKEAPGGDFITIEDLAPEIDASLEALSKSLLAETYRPRKLRRAFIRKPSGGRRPLSIPAVIDRVTQTAAMLVLGPELDTRMSETSLAYRVGRGPLQASPRSKGADIKSYFDKIRHRQLMTDLAIWIDDERILRLILSRPVEDGAAFCDRQMVRSWAEVTFTRTL